MTLVMIHYQSTARNDTAYKQHASGIYSLFLFEDSMLIDGLQVKKNE